MADWLSIKAEYVNSRISTRDLAAKHGVSASQVMRRSAKEGWPELREQQRSRTEAECLQKTASALAASQADRIVLLMDAGTKAAGLLAHMLDAAAQTGDIKPGEIKTITDALKNIRDLYRSDETPDDAKYQKARDLLRGVPDALE